MSKRLERISRKMNSFKDQNGVFENSEHTILRNIKKKVSI